MKFKFLIAAFMLAINCGFNTASAGLIVNINETAGNVVVTYSGSLDLSTTFFDTSRLNMSHNNLWSACDGCLQSYNAGGENIDDYNLPTWLSSPTSFTLSGSLSGGSIVGDAFLIDIGPNFGQFWMPLGYQSGQNINGSNTFIGSSLAGIGANNGTYIWTWGRNNAIDSLTVTVGTITNDVPEPSTLAIFALGIMGLASRKFKKQC